MGGSHETPFKMKGSGHYGLGNSSPAKAKSPTKDRETWSLEHDRAGAAAHNASKATASHHGAPHGPKPPEMKEGDGPGDKGFTKVTDDEGNVIE